MRYAIIPLLLLAACVTPQQKELTAAKAIGQTRETAAQALDLGILKADQGSAILAATNVAEEALKRAIASRRAGEPTAAWESALKVALDALAEATKILEGRAE